MKSCRDVIHDASNLLDVRPACVVELSVARFARTKDQTAHGTWPRKHSVHGLVAQKRRACVLSGHGGCPRLANVARARESGLHQAASATPKSGLRGLPKLSKHDHLILKCPKTHEGAQLGLGRDMRHQAISRGTGARLAPARGES